MDIKHIIILLSLLTSRNNLFSCKIAFIKILTSKDYPHPLPQQVLVTFPVIWLEIVLVNIWVIWCKTSIDLLNSRIRPNFISKPCFCTIQIEFVWFLPFLLVLCLLLVLIGPRLQKPKVPIESPLCVRSSVTDYLGNCWMNFSEIWYVDAS